MLDGRAGVDAPGRYGSPVLSVDGALVGLAITRGRRRVVMRSIGSVLPFLRRVVLGAAP